MSQGGQDLSLEDLTLDPTKSGICGWGDVGTVLHDFVPFHRVKMCHRNLFENGEMDVLQKFIGLASHVADHIRNCY